MCISAITGQICTKFGLPIDVHHTTVLDLGPKLHFLKMQDGDGRHLEFSIFHHISVVNENIFVKFGALINIGHTRAAVAQYPTFGKIQDGGSRHHDLSILAISRS